MLWAEGATGSVLGPRDSDVQHTAAGRRADLWHPDLTISHSGLVAWVGCNRSKSRQIRKKIFRRYIQNRISQYASNMQQP